MKILVLGDFEGTVPKGFQSFVKRIEPDIIVYVGDFPDRSKTRKIEWSLWDKKLDKEAFNREFKKRVSKIIGKEIETGKKVMKEIADTKLPILFVLGNHDYDEKHGYLLLKYSKKFKNMKHLHRKSVRVNGFTFIGHSGYRGFAGKQDLFRKDLTKKERKDIERIKTKYRKELDKLFSGKKNIIFITHDVPYNIKFDKINNKNSPINGKHIGDDVYREYDLKNKPMIHFCGHMHEYQGKTKLGKTDVILPGFGKKGKVALVTLPDKKVKFYQL